MKQRSPRKRQKKCCVYTIRCSDGRVYVGGTTDFAIRRNKHLSDLRLNRHDNKRLQRAWNSKGESHFRIEPEKLCDPPELLTHEQQCLDAFRALGPVFNVGIHAEFSTKGVKPSAVTRKRLSQACSGRVNSHKHNERISVGRRGTPHELVHPILGLAVIVNMRLWCRKLCLDRRHILLVIKGARQSYKGWRLPC